MSLSENGCASFRHRSRAYDGSALPAERPQPTCILTNWRGEVREKSVRTRREPLGARRCTCQYIEHDKPAQRNHGGLIACFPRQVVRYAGQHQEDRDLLSRVKACP